MTWLVISLVWVLSVTGSWALGWILGHSEGYYEGLTEDPINRTAKLAKWKREEERETWRS